jgi:3D (Asp-Asp-Asp) domain-containing protein
MFRNKIIIPVLMFAFFFMGFLLFKTDVVMAASDLSIGSRGTQVVQLQDALNTKGYWCGTADGIFGTKTSKAVTEFQQATGLNANGIVGTETEQALGLTSTSDADTVSRGSYTRGTNTMTMVATGYDNSYEANYPYYGQPSYTGLPLQRGVVAVDPNVIPMGTRLYVEGYGDAIAADQGGAIKGNRIDLFFDSHQEAMNWGMKTIKVTVLD